MTLCFTKIKDSFPHSRKTSDSLRADLTNVPMISRKETEGKKALWQTWKELAWPSSLTRYLNFE